MRRPHLSFYYPQEFGALYPPAEQIAPPAHPNPPTGMPLAAWHEGNFNNKWGKPCNDTRPFRRAYYSAVSFTDDNIGKLLAEVDTLGLKQNTLVAIMGDHVRRNKRHARARFYAAEKRQQKRCAVHACQSSPAVCADGRDGNWER